MVTWVDGFSPELIAERIEKSKTINADGRATFDGFEHTEHVAILASMLRMNLDIPEIERFKIINQATYFAGGKGIVTAESIRTQVNLGEKNYLKQPKQRFRLVTSISLAIPSEAQVFTINSSRISTGGRVERKTLKTHAKIVLDAQSTIVGDMPSFYAPISVTVTARSSNEAGTKALDDLDLLRGIWNLFNNRRHTIRISSGARSPVNAMILGPVHTLHKMNGEQAADAWWYEPTYRGPVQIWRDAARFPKMLAYTRKFRGYLHDVPYRDDFESSLIRYTRALDSRDWNYSFLQLWSILELLTGTTQNDSHKVTVKRAAFVFADFEYAKQSLLHLRAYRNKSVHTGTEADNVETLMYQLKRIVEVLLEFHARRAGRFQSMAEVAEFLDSPSDRVSIDAEIRKLKAVRKFLTV